ncbi:MAG: entericidin A/B family lipoprotein [Rickettsiales bacterium]|nr:entericidin A/B family lipoprotein [Rickettsiales bacterium]
MRKIFILSILLVIANFTSSCNTIRGIGQDIEGAGRSLQRTSDY